MSLSWFTSDINLHHPGLQLLVVIVPVLASRRRAMSRRATLTKSCYWCVCQFTKLTSLQKKCHNVRWLISHWSVAVYDCPTLTPQDKRLNWLTAEYIVQLFVYLVNGSVGRVHLCIRTMTFMKVERTQRSQRSKETGQAIFSHITEASRIHTCPQLTFGFLWYKMLSLYLYIFYSVRHSKVTNDKVSNSEIKFFDGD